MKICQEYDLKTHQVWRVPQKGEQVVFENQAPKMLDQFVYLLNNHFTQHELQFVCMFPCLLKDCMWDSACRNASGCFHRCVIFCLDAVISEHITFRNLISTKRKYSPPGSLDAHGHPCPCDSPWSWSFRKGGNSTWQRRKGRNSSMFHWILVVW